MSKFTAATWTRLRGFPRADTERACSQAWPVRKGPAETEPLTSSTRVLAGLWERQGLGSLASAQGYLALRPQVRLGRKQVPRERTLQV